MPVVGIHKRATNPRRQHGGREAAEPEKAPRRASPAPDRLHRRGAGTPQSPRRPPEGRAPRRTGFREGGRDTAGPEKAPRRAGPAPDRLQGRGQGGRRAKTQLQAEKTRPIPPYTKPKFSKKDPKSLWRGVKTSGR